MKDNILVGSTIQFNLDAVTGMRECSIPGEAPPVASFAFERCYLSRETFELWTTLAAVEVEGESYAQKGSQLGRIRWEIHHTLLPLSDSADGM